MSWGTEYADRDHSHREIDDERFDRERAISDSEIGLNSRIDDIRSDCNAAREELWGEIHELRDQIKELQAQLGDHVHKVGSHG
jgi:polyhydroxyalkanoate synthesis regulator phasin